MVEEVKVRVLPGNRISRSDYSRMGARTTKTLCEWAAKGWGPRPIRVGGRIFYDYDECMATERGERPVKPELQVA